LDLCGEEDNASVEISNESTQKRFRQLIYKQFIESRSVALDSLMEGLTLDGKECGGRFRFIFPYF
jgi:hypothetical protein